VGLCLWPGLCTSASMLSRRLLPPMLLLFLLLLLLRDCWAIWGQGQPQDRQVRTGRGVWRHTVQNRRMIWFCTLATRAPP
jgi:hypothetical protein